MTKWGRLLLVAACIVWAIVETVHDFKADNPIVYFAEKPHRLLYVVAISVVGGLGAFAYDRFSPGTKRNLKLLALAGAATFFTGFAADTGYGFFSHLSYALSESVGMVLLVTAILLFFASFAGLFWIEFVQVLKTGRTRWINKVL